jgi:hypothetical protein
MRWLPWAAGACGCIICAALGFVYLITYGALRIIARSTAEKLAHPAPPPPALEAAIAVVSAQGQALTVPAAGGPNYRYSVRLRNAGTSALLVQHVHVTFHAATGRQLAAAELLNSVVLPGEPQEFGGELKLEPALLKQISSARAQVIPTPLGQAR